ITTELSRELLHERANHARERLIRRRPRAPYAHVAGRAHHDALDVRAARVDADDERLAHHTDGPSATLHPPSTASTWPVTKRDASESRYTTAASRSSGRPTRPPSSGWRAAT